MSGLWSSKYVQREADPYALAISVVAPLVNMGRFVRRRGLVWRPGRRSCVTVMGFDHPGTGETEEHRSTRSPTT